MFPDRFSTGAVIDGDPDDVIDDEDVESTTMLPPEAVTFVEPESATVVPEGPRTRMAAVE